MPQTSFDFETALRVLAHHGVKFIVVGSVCATLNGVTLPTMNLEVVHLRSRDNLENLVAALSDLDAHYRDRASIDKLPNIESLTSPDHHLLMTRAGPLDVLGVIPTNRDYQQLEQNCIAVLIEDGLEIYTLDLPTLIETKQESSRQIDRLAVPILLNALEERERKE